MQIQETMLSGAYLIECEPMRDSRGLFARTYCQREFEAIGHKKEFVQFNHSHNNEKGTLRGMHYQLPPFSEIKLIRCVKGSVFDVIVDIRQDSPTFLQHFGVELSEQNMRMLYIPEGFCHGFQTLEDHTALIYHHTAFYTPGYERGLLFDDPAIGINWPLVPTQMSEKDQHYAALEADFSGIQI